MPNNQNKSSHQYSRFKVGEKDDTGAIIKVVYCRGKSYVIYGTDEKALFKYQHSSNELLTAPIESALFETVQLLKSKRDKSKFVISIAAAVKLCLEGKAEEAITFLNKISQTIKHYIKVKNTIQYLSVYVVILIFLLIASFSIHSELGMNSLLTQLALIGTSGAVGGFMSLAIRIRKLMNEVFEDRRLNTLSAVIRMIFSIIAGIVTYFFIRANIVFGFVDNLEVNFFVILTFATAAGFSEKFVPEILTGIGNEKEQRN